MHLPFPPQPKLLLSSHMESNPRLSSPNGDSARTCPNLDGGRSRKSPEPCHTPSHHVEYLCSSFSRTFRKLEVSLTKCPLISSSLFWPNEAPNDLAKQILFGLLEVKTASACFVSFKAKGAAAGQTFPLRTHQRWQAGEPPRSLYSKS